MGGRYYPPSATLSTAAMGLFVTGWLSHVDVLGLKSQDYLEKHKRNLIKRGVIIIRASILIWIHVFALHICLHRGILCTDSPVDFQHHSRLALILDWCVETCRQCFMVPLKSSFFFPLHLPKS